MSASMPAQRAFNAGELLRSGLLPFAILGSLSLVSSLAIVIWLTYRMVYWKKFYKTYLGYNQSVVLVYNLLLADAMQAVAFVISFNWFNPMASETMTRACFTQSWFIHFGDVSAGFFVLVIAIHTLLSLGMGVKIKYGIFVAAVVFIWGAAMVLTWVGPAIHTGFFMPESGKRCWIVMSYESTRFWLHYVWVFVSQFGTLVIYFGLIIHLLRRVNGIRDVKASARVRRVAKYMIVYPVIYVVCTMPLAAGRVSSLAGRELPQWFYPVAGSMLASLGWLDALLYTLTKKVLIGSELGRDGQTATDSADSNSLEKGGSHRGPSPSASSTTSGPTVSLVAPETGAYEKHPSYQHTRTPSNMTTATAVTTPFPEFQQLPTTSYSRPHTPQSLSFSRPVTPASVSVGHHSRNPSQTPTVRLPSRPSSRDLTPLDTNVSYVSNVAVPHPSALTPGGGLSSAVTPLSAGPPRSRPSYPTVNTSFSSTSSASKALPSLPPLADPSAYTPYRPSTRDRELSDAASVRSAATTDPRMYRGAQQADPAFQNLPPLQHQRSLSSASAGGWRKKKSGRRHAPQESASSLAVVPQGNSPVSAWSP